MASTTMCYIGIIGYILGMYGIMEKKMKLLSSA